MSKILFTPFSMLAGLLAGLIGKAIFSAIWSRVDADDPPTPDDPDATFKRLLTAALLQGALFAAIRMATDHAARRAFFSLTGSWPGFTEEEDPEAAAAAAQA